MIREINSNDYRFLEHKFNLGNIEQELRENLTSKYFIYTENNHIIGFINYFDLIDRFEIANIVVLEDSRNKKIGYKLLSYIIKIGEKRNIENITLEVNINNSFAIKLYDKCNFKVVAIRKRYYNGQDGYLMERKMI